MNPRDAMVRVTHPPTDKESKDEDRNRWSFRSSDSLKLPAPGFFELDALINRVSLKNNNNNIRHEKRERPTTHRISRSSMIFQNSSSASFNDHIVSLRPRPTISSLVDTRQRVCDRHENTRPRRRRGDCIHVEKQKTSVDFNRCLPYHMHQEKFIRLAWSGMSGQSGRSGRFNCQKSLPSHFSQNLYITITIS